MSSPVKLRPLLAEDSAMVLEWRNRPEVARYMYTDHEISPDEHAHWLASALDDRRCEYWVIEVGSGPAGLASLTKIDHRNRRCALASYLANPAARGRGIGSYVDYRLLDRAFGDLALERMWCEVLAFNEPGIRVHQSVGFTIEAVLRKHVLKGGERHDVVVLGMLAEEWREQRAQIEERFRARGFL